MASSVSISSISAGWPASQVDEQNNFNCNISISSPKRLVGRVRELQVLRDTFDEIKESRISKRVFVHGVSGTGKTSLVLALRKHVVQGNGFFCSGKYFQNYEVTPDPYSALMAAFSDLCDLVLQCSDDERISHIQRELQSSGQYLVRAVTNISPFLKGDQEFDFHESRKILCFANFKAACINFLRVMSCNSHPVVLFLDDVQWMDDGSRELIEGFVNAEDTMKNLMLILAYRDEEKKAVKGITSGQSASGAIDVQVGNLDLDSICEITSSHLTCKSREALADLNKLIVQKTQGNPHHVLEFLSTIRKEGFIEDIGGSLIVDIEAIKREMMISDSFADLLSLNVRRLDIQMQNVLKVAALLGYWSPENVLLDVSVEQFYSNGSSDTPSKCITNILNQAICEGFLDKIDNGYQFTHDKIQTSFYSLMGAGEREKLHIAIGRKLLEYPSTKAKYQAAVHLNRATEMKTEEGRNVISNVPISDGGFAIWLAKINVEASKFCIEMSAFKSSIIFLKKGLELLEDEEKWLKHYNLAFELTETLAQMEFVVHNFAACRLANNEVLHRARTRDVAIKAHAREIEVCVDSFTFDRRKCKKTLKELGIRFPAFLQLALVRKVLAVRKLLGKKTDNDILSMPSCQGNQQVVTTIKTLNLICGDALFRKDALVAAYSCIMAVELTLKEGISDQSAHAIVHWALFEVMQGNENIGCRLGELALKMIGKKTMPNVACIVIANATFFCLFRKKAIGECIEHLPCHLNAAFRIGCFRDLHFAHASNFLFRIMLGDNLQELERSMREVHQLLYDYGGRDSTIIIQPAVQFVLNLQNCEVDDWKQLTNLTGEIMNEDQFVRDLPREKSEMFDLPRKILKMILCYGFGFYEDANAIGVELSDSKNAFGHFAKSCVSIPCQFFFGMNSYKLFTISDATDQRRYLRQARKCKKYFIELKDAGSPNALPFLGVLEAEDTALKSKSVEEICQTYDRALAFNSKMGIPYLEAVASESWARHLYRLGDVEMAKVLMERSKNVNRYKWGATARYCWLSDVYDYVEQPL